MASSRAIMVLVRHKIIRSAANPASKAIVRAISKMETRAHGALRRTSSKAKTDRAKIRAMPKRKIKTAPIRTNRPVTIPKTSKTADNVKVNNRDKVSAAKMASERKTANASKMVSRARDSKASRGKAENRRRMTNQVRMDSKCRTDNKPARVVDAEARGTG